MQTANHTHLFNELRRRNERRARVARLLEARRDRNPKINRVVQLHRTQRKAY